MAFPFWLMRAVHKNTLLAGYAALQHIAWVIWVMQLPVADEMLYVNVNQ
jgi:hypothetical protein